MDFFEHLHKYMMNNTKLKEAFASRIYPLIMPQQPSYPAIVYSPISAKYDKNLTEESGFIRQTVQFSIYDKTFGKVRKASRIVRNALKDFKGDMAGQTIDAVHSITDITAKSNNSENFSMEEYCAILEFEFQYKEEI